MQTHHLKTWPEYFQQIKTGQKQWELRKNDRDFKTGDTIILEEWDPETETYTGETVIARAGYILYGGVFGLPPDSCIISLQRINNNSVIRQIKMIVSLYMDVSIDDMEGPSQKREHVVPRQLCIYFSRKHSGLTLKELARLFGKKDHSTVCHAIETITDLCQFDKTFRSQFVEIEKQIIESISVNN